MPAPIGAAIQAPPMSRSLDAMALIKRTITASAPSGFLQPLLEALWDGRSEGDRCAGPDRRGGPSHRARRREISRQRLGDARSSRRNRRAGRNSRPRIIKLQLAAIETVDRVIGTERTASRRVRHRVPRHACARAPTFIRARMRGSNKASAATDFTASAFNMPRGARRIAACSRQAHRG